MALTIDDVIDQMLQRGMEPPPAGKLDADGRKVTWAGDARKPKKKNAWAALKEWRSPKTGKVYIVGRFGIRDEWWPVEPTQTEWTPAERAAWLEERKAIERAQQTERAEQAAAAATKAERLWARARTDGVSEYLNRKQVGAWGVRFAFGRLVVPLADVHGKLHGLQWIGPDGSKTFGTGTVKEGHFHLLGEVKDGEPLAFAEGYATAATGRKAVGWPVVACFDAGNLMPVVAAFRKLYQEHEFVLLADDDRHLVARLCERLERHGVTVSPADFARSAGGLRDMRWDLPDGRTVALAARWAKDKAGVWFIEGSINADGVAHLLRLENAGRAKAFAAAKRHGARVIVPRFADRADTGTDFNDLMLSEGVEVVREQLLAPPPEQPRKGSVPQPSAGASHGDQGGRLVFPYLDEKYVPKGIRENVYFALLEDPALRDLVRYNDFSQELDRMRPAPWSRPDDPPAGRWMSPLDDLRLAAYLAAEHRLVVGNPSVLEQAVLMSASDARHNPLREWLDALVWDGTERLPFWMIDGMEAEDTEYVRKVSVYFMLSMVARVFEPGCQMDYMLVLQGEQGRRKTSLMEMLAGEWFGSGSFRVGEKDSLQALQGRWLFNFGELDALNKSEDTAIKQFITNRTDRFRPPYGKHFEPYPRTCVLTGDTNKTEFLKDPTGARRFWVVACGEVNVDTIRDMREQLLAEAVHHYRRGDLRYPVREEYERLFKPEEERWRLDDVWMQPLIRYVNSPKVQEQPWPGTVTRSNGPILPNRERAFFSTEELLTQALKVEIGKADGAGIAVKRIGDAMKSPAMGFVVHRWGKHRVRGYLRVLKARDGVSASDSGPLEGANA